jgi:hypothetical protein
MNKTSSSSKKISDWQAERGQILHGLFSDWQSKDFSGKTLHLAISQASDQLNGKPFKSDPAHKWSASTSRLYQLYRKWQHGGQLPSALNLNFSQVQEHLPAALLIRFINFWAARDFESLRAAWEIFCRRGGNFGPGRVRGVPLQLGLQALLCNLPAGFVRKIVREQKAKNDALAKINSLRLAAQVEIKNRVPAKLSRPQDFQI